ncbi:UDP-2,4-diacetamido-2,4,6-trideoxy-beta-L-altropyranose hydrolase [Thalassotalea castellviae]|uniref:UDP-2,4-diacetamido-2,4, 6-trideoxy-beta-L-altropyranose hydrolase n=1 Tax=Thalassotalea castellviae TaxID=3075612 RepID=A0ABU2ZY54_9GAMM|nr:UDP-2,4-diacetamido-2,4,6-trideoxy-beta-L-altropyranose hydrolase [Thalassotalea sp. W431]MDT0602859.1 UDP-2,4-diacetamido-2,4,6-trideoxy-beta-L-altropyranose hydrolase [Thalassotalea sp. W431]
MHIAFRADASAKIGTGHIMRCLTLADLLSQYYQSRQSNNVPRLMISFLSAPLPQSLQQKIITAGYHYRELKLDKHDHSQEHDASCCHTLLKRLPKINLLIVDHYQLAKKWQQLLTADFDKIMVIDDLANRQHQCDYLLDQTFARRSQDYQPYVNSHCLTFIGQHYILLRDEFLSAVKTAEKRRASTEKIDNILVTMGGMDEDNASTTIINYLIALRTQEQLSFNVTIVLGSQAPNLASLMALIEPYQWITLQIDSNSMAQLMLSADLAIGASGTTAWERCSLGLPTLVVIMADNQNLVASNLAKQGAVINLGDFQSLSYFKLEQAFLQLTASPKAYQTLVRQCFDTIKQSKVSTMLDIIMTSIKLAPATNDDKDIIFSWQSNPDIRRFSRNNQAIPYQEHCQWFSQAIADQTRHIYLIQQCSSSEQAKNAGMIRFDEINAREVEVSILVAPDMQGKKVALRALFATPKIFKQKTIHAYVHPDNIASQHLFRSANYRQIADDHFILSSENNQ